MKVFKLPQLVGLGLILAGLTAFIGTPSRVEFLIAAPEGQLGLRLDQLSASLLIFIGFLGMVIARYAARNLAGPRRTTRFAFLIGLLALVAGNDLLTMAVGWSLSGLAVAALIGHATSQQAQQASVNIRRRLIISDVALWSAVVIGLVTLPGIERGNS